VDHDGVVAAPHDGGAGAEVRGDVALAIARQSMPTVYGVEPQRDGVGSTVHQSHAIGRKLACAGMSARDAESRAKVSWSNATPWVASLFVVLCLATIPIGRPVPDAIMLGLGALGLMSVLLGRFDQSGRWATVTCWPVIVVLATILISIFACRLPRLALERSTTSGVFALIAISVQIAFWNRSALMLILLSCAALIGTMTGDVIWQRVTGQSLLGAVPGGSVNLSGSFGNRNDLTVVSLLLPLALALVSQSKSVWIVLTMAGVGGVPVWLSSSRQALLAWFTSVSIVLVSRLSRRRAVGVLCAVACAVVLVVVLTPALRMRAHQTLREGVGIREQLTVYGLRLFAQEPLTGIGPGLFGQYYRLDAESGWSWRGTPLPKVGMPWVHSLPVEVLCEVGVLGSLAYGAVITMVVHRCWRRRRMPGLNGRVAIGTLACLASGAVVGLVDLTFIKDWVRCVFWLAIGLGSVTGAASSKPADR